MSPERAIKVTFPPKPPPDSQSGPVAFPPDAFILEILLPITQFGTQLEALIEVITRVAP